MGVPLPGALRGVADRLGIAWPQTDEAELDRIGTRFIETAARFRVCQNVVFLDTEAMLAVNHSDALDAFRVFRDRVAGPGDSHMIASAVAASMIGASYLAASVIVMSLKIAVITHLVRATFAFAVESVVIAAGGTALVPVLREWIEQTAQETVIGVEQAYQHAVTALDRVFAPVESGVTFTKTATARLQARPADRSRSGPGGTSAAGLVPPHQRAQTNPVSQAAGREANGIEYTRRWADATVTDQDKAGVQDFGSHVPYGGTDLAQAVIEQRRKDQQRRDQPGTSAEERRKIGKPGERNYAAVRLRNGEQFVTDSSGSPDDHSETKIYNELVRRRQAVRDDPTLDEATRRARLEGLEVDQLYTERQPCARLCQKVCDPAKTTWTFPWEPEQKRPKSAKTVRDVIRERS